MTKPDWLANHDISILVYAGPKQPDLNAPNVEDLARSDDDRRTMQLITSGTRLGRPLTTSPRTPADRVQALRAAFQAVMKDPDFLKDAQAARIEVDPVRGEEMQKVVSEVLATPANLRTRARPLLE